MLAGLQHVARLSRRLPVVVAAPPFRPPRPREQPLARSFTTAPHHLARHASEGRIDSYIQSSLDEMNVVTPSHMPKGQLSVPRSADPGSLVTARFAPGQHVVKAQDRAVLAALAHARSVQRLAFYRARRAARPLWLDWLVHQAGCSPVVVSLAKRRMRLALRLALAARGVHKYGWRREAVDKAWAAGRAARRAKVKDGNKNKGGPDLEALWREAGVPALTGTVWVTIKKPKELVVVPFSMLRQIADCLVGGMLEKHKNAGAAKAGDAGKTRRKAGKPARRSGDGDLEAEFGDLGPSLTKDDFF